MKSLKRIVSATVSLALAGVVALTPAAAITTQTSFIIESSGEVVAAPESYRVTSIINRFGSQLGVLNTPVDINFDDEGNLYIVDKGNLRVLKTDNQGNVLAVWCKNLPKPETIEETGEEETTDTVTDTTDTTESTDETETTDTTESTDTTSTTTNNTVVTSGSDFVDIPGIDAYRGEDGTVEEGTKIDITLDGRQVTIIYTELKNPSGVYVDDDGDIYICDTDNHRVLIYNKDYSVDRIFDEEHVQNPEKLGGEYKFLPEKIAVSDTGLIYVLNQTSFQGFFTMNAEGEFLSYVGATKVTASATDVLVQIFGTQAQKNAVQNKQPPPATNLTMEGNMIYATCTLSSTSSDVKRIMQINVVGEDLFPAGEYAFSDYSASSGEQVTTDYVDIAVDKNGIVTVLDDQLGYIVQYNEAGDMVTAFGGMGNRKGLFMKPTSIDIDPVTGYIYVSDSSKGNIQVFAPTEFISKVHEASALYFDGLYEEALSIWNDVLAIDETYMHAHAGVGEAYYGYGQNVAAMEKFEYSYDYEGYDKAFNDFRMSAFRSYFTPIMITIICLIVLCYIGFIKLKHLADEYYK